MPTYEDFHKIEMRVGTIVDVHDFEKARNPSYKIWVDFGEFGIKKTSAQITDCCDRESLLGKQIVGIINFPDKNIAGFISEFLLMGVVGEKESKAISLISPSEKVENGMRVL